MGIPLYRADLLSFIYCWCDDSIGVFTHGLICVSVVLKKVEGHVCGCNVRLRDGVML